MSPRRRLITAVLAIIGVYIVGTAGYALIERIPLFDAAYMAAITISTVGYDEHITLSHAGRLWTIFFILFGVAGTSFAVTSLVTLFVSGDLRDMLGKRKVQAMVDKLRKHVIFCGYGRMGVLAIEDLRRHDVPIVVIERDAQICAKLRDAGIAFVQGDATEEETLLQAGLVHCAALVTALPHDADNVYVTLTAHGIRADMTIIARAELPSTELKLKRAGATRVICPQVVGATKIANTLTRPNVVEFVDLAAEGLELEIDEFKVAADSTLCGKTLRDAPVRQTAGAIIVAIKRQDGAAVYQPGPEELILAGDMLIMIGKTGVSARLHGLAKPTS